MYIYECLQPQHLYIPSHYGMYAESQKAEEQDVDTCICIHNEVTTNDELITGLYVK